MAKDCPVTIIKVDKMPLINNVIQWDYKNTSTKKIVGVKFAIVLADAVGDHRSPTYTFVDKVSLKPDEKHRGVYAPPLELHEATGGAWVALGKVLFEDGTYWQDGGCEKLGTWK
jgi:hypothetical protein